MKYVFGFLLIALFAVSAYDFSAKILSVSGRGSYNNNVLLIANCNDPTKSQTVYLTMDISFPEEDCSDQIEIFYSYYDFPSKSYTNEQQLCLISSSKSCKGSFNINLGGTGEDSINVDEYVRLRAVCKANSNEFETTLPISINHFATNAEGDALSKISDADAILYDAESVLDYCKTCDSNKLYVLKNNLDNLKYQIGTCNFTSYVAIVTDIKTSAQNLKTEYESTYASEEVNVDKDVEDVTEKIDEVKDTMDDLKDEIDSKVNKTINTGLDNVPTSSKGFCMVGLLFPLLVLGLYFYKN